MKGRKQARKTEEIKKASEQAAFSCFLTQVLEDHIPVRGTRQEYAQDATLSKLSGWLTFEHQAALASVHLLTIPRCTTFLSNRFA